MLEFVVSAVSTDVGDGGGGGGGCGGAVFKYSRIHILV